MGSEKWGDDYFGEQVRKQRNRKDWTQARLAEQLTANGFRMTAAQVARIEKGTRSVRAVEASVLADLFEVSVDALLGKRARPKADLEDAVIAVLETQQDTRRSLSSVARTLSRAAETLAAADTGGRYTSLVDDCERARKALATADKVVEKIGATTQLGSVKAEMSRLLGVGSPSLSSKESK